MGETWVRLTRTIGDGPVGADGRGFVVLAGTVGRLRRVRRSPDVVLEDFEAGREGALCDCDDGCRHVGYAEVDFADHLDWTATGLRDESPGFEPLASGWTVLNVPLEYLEREDA